MKIKDMIVGQKVSVRLPLASADVRQTKGNPPRDFLSAVFTDGTDQLDGKIWGYKNTGAVPEAAKCYDIQGTIGEYLGKKQITITGMHISEDQDMASFQPAYCDNALEYYNAALEMIEQIENSNLHTLVRTIYLQNKAEIVKSSSAKGVHHVGNGGNIVHTVEVASVAMAMTKAMAAQGYNLDMDLVIAGALLHDIGKPATYTVDGAAIVYTKDGMLLDHITLGILLVERAADECATPTAMKKAVQHMIASHHGELEYGSPVTPLCMEAYIVNYADGVSATLNTIHLANKKAIDEGKDMTSRLFTCHNREHFLQGQMY